MEEGLKQVVKAGVNARLGIEVDITVEEWEALKKDALNHIYVHKLMFFKVVPSEYFISILIEILAMKKRVAA